jgi:hypothetical protein
MHIQLDLLDVGGSPGKANCLRKLVLSDQRAEIGLIPVSLAQDPRKSRVRQQ